MRHAYLIIAHNEFDVLQHLLNALDDRRNDVFIYIDKKVKSYPNLYMRDGRLPTLKNSVEVYWGHISQIGAEYLLFETASEKGPYAYYPYNFRSTPSSVQSKSHKVFKRYRYSFCGDEFFVPSVLENMSFKSNVVYYNKLLKCDFEGVNTKTYSLVNYEDIITSGCLFARKFSAKDIGVVEKILNNINSHTE